MFNFSNLFKKKKDDEDIKIRIKPNLRPKMDTSRMSVAPVYKNSRSSSFSQPRYQTTDVPRTQRIKPQPVKKTRVKVYKDPDQENFSALRKYSDFNRRNLEEFYDTPRMDSPDYNWKNPEHILGTISRGTGRVLMNTLPTITSDTLTGLHRLGRSAKNQLGYKAIETREGLNALRGRKSFGDAMRDSRAQIQQQIQNQGGYQYNPITGRFNTIQNENLWRKNQGQSVPYAAMHATLDTALPFFDIADFGSSAAIKTGVGTGIKYGAPMLGTFFRRAPKITPEALEAAKKINKSKGIPFGKEFINKRNEALKTENFIDWLTKKRAAESKIKAKQAREKNKVIKKANETFDDTNAYFGKPVEPQKPFGLITADQLLDKQKKPKGAVQDIRYSTFGNPDQRLYSTNDPLFQNQTMLFDSSKTPYGALDYYRQGGEMVNSPGVYGIDYYHKPGSFSDITRASENLQAGIYKPRTPFQTTKALTPTLSSEKATPAMRLASENKKIFDTNYPVFNTLLNNSEGILPITRAPLGKDGRIIDDSAEFFNKDVRSMFSDARKAESEYDTSATEASGVEDKLKKFADIADEQAKDAKEIPQNAPVREHNIADEDALADYNALPENRKRTIKITKDTNKAPIKIKDEGTKKIADTKDTKKVQTKFIQKGIDDTRTSTEDMAEAIGFAEGTKTGKKAGTVKGADKRIKVITDTKPSTKKLKITTKKPIVNKIVKEPTDKEFKMDRATRPEKEGKTNLFTSGNQELVNEKATGVKKLFNMREEHIRNVKGKFDSFAKKIFGKTKVNKEDFREAAKYIQNDRKGPVNESTKKIADDIKYFFSRAEQIAKDNGVDMGHIDNYFPAMYKKQYLSGGKYEQDTLRHFVDKGYAKNEKEAKELLKQFTEFDEVVPTDYKGRKQSFELHRKYTFPEDAYITDRGVLSLYAEKLAKRIGDIKTLGSKDEALVAAINEAVDMGGNRKNIEAIVDQHLKRNEWSKGDEVADVATRLVNVVALPFAGIKNASQAQNFLAHGGVKNSAKAIKESLTKEGRAFAKEANAYNPEYLIQDSTENAPWLAERISGATMSATEKALRTASSIVGRGKLHDLVKKVSKGIPAKDSKKYKLLVDDLYQIGLTLDEAKDAAKNGISRELELKSGRAFSDYTQFIIDALQTPRKWRTPKGRLLSQYLSFAYKQTGLFRDAVNRAKNGDPKPLLTYLIVSPPITFTAAYLTNQAKNIVFNTVKKIGGYDDEDVQARPAIPAYKEGDSKLKYGADLTSKAYSGAVGLPANIYDKGSRIYDTITNDKLTGGQKAVRIAGTVSPTAGLAANFADAALDVGATKKENAEQEAWKDTKDPYKSLKREAVSIVPFAGEEANNAVPSLRYNSHKKSLADDAKGFVTKKITSNKPLKVSRIKDGDTIVLQNGQVFRFDGIDTPESNTDQGKAVKNYINNKLKGKKVEVVYDADRRGAYGREVVDILVDGKSINEELIRNGLARAKSYGANSVNAEKYAKLQEQAEKEGKGFWGNSNLQIALQGEDYGKDPNMFEKLWYLDKGKNKVDFNDKNIKTYEGMSAEEAKKKAKEKGHDLTDKQLFAVRATADGFSDYFLGGFKNPTNEFPSGKGVTLQDKLTAAYKKSKGDSPETVLKNVYTAENYTDEEKNKLYKKMGFTKPEAERATLYAVKSEGMSDASPVILSYLETNGFNEKNVKNLIEDKTLTKPQIKDMYDQDLISDGEYDYMLALYKDRSSWSKSGTGKGGKRSKNDGNRTSNRKSSRKSSKKKKGTIKITAYKIPETKPTKKDYFKDLMAKISTKDPTIKLKTPPKAKAIDSSFKVNVPKKQKRAKIKVDFDTGLI